ncbi:MAG: substrate-binding domain-containing protein [Pseudomonadota bacterium]
MSKTALSKSAQSNGPKRRTLLKTALGGGGALASAPLVAATSTAASAEDDSVMGPPRRFAWVTHSIGEWNLAMDVAYNDFAEQFGWTYQKYGIPGGTYDLEGNINQIRLAVRSQPDVLISTIAASAIENALVEAENAGIVVLVNNTTIGDITDDHDWGYIGADGYSQGLISGRLMGQYLIDNGRNGGVVSFGNTQPGLPTIEERRRGTEDALNQINDDQGTSFTLQEFADQSHDLAQSIPLYSAVRNSLGDNLAGFAVSGYGSMIAAFRMLQQAGVPPGQIPVGGMDSGPEITEGIDLGYIIYAVEQELYNQAYLACSVAWSRLERNEVPPKINTGTAVVNKDNLQFFSDRADIVLDRANELGLRY